MAFMNLGPNLMNTIIKTIVYGLITVFVCTVLGLLYFTLRKLKQFRHYQVVIIKKKKDRDGNIQPVFSGIDKGAIIIDKKSKKRYFKLMKNKVRLGEEETENFDENRELDIPSIPSELGGELVILEKLGPKKFAFGTTLFIDSVVKVIVSEADCAEAIRSYDVNAKHYTEAGWKQWIGPVSFAVFAVLTLILIFNVLQKFEVLTQVADKLVETAKILQAGRQVAVASGVP